MAEAWSNKRGLPFFSPTRAARRGGAACGPFGDGGVGASFATCIESIVASCERAPHTNHKPHFSLGRPPPAQPSFSGCARCRCGGRRAEKERAWPSLPAWLHRRAGRGWRVFCPGPFRRAVGRLEMFFPFMSCLGGGAHEAGARRAAGGRAAVALRAEHQNANKQKPHASGAPRALLRDAPRFGRHEGAQRADERLSWEISFLVW